MNYEKTHENHMGLVVGFFSNASVFAQGPDIELNTLSTKSEVAAVITHFNNRKVEAAQIYILYDPQVLEVQDKITTSPNLMKLDYTVAVKKTIPGKIRVVTIPTMVSPHPLFPDEKLYFIFPK